MGAAELIVVPNSTHQARPWAGTANVIVSEAIGGWRAGTALLEHLSDVAEASGCYKVRH